VSILLITYNHEKYIGQALESILMQETEYDYEINVIEDCSTDKTREVVMRYVERYPDKVKPFFNAKNIGSKVTQRNFYRGFKTLRGEYFAILEGDDYWTSAHKLQKQVAFLKGNPDYVACAHHTLKVYEDGSRPPERFLHWEGKSNEITIYDLILLDRCLHVASIMYRNVFMGVPPRFFINRWSCEICVNITHAQFGNIRYFDEDMAVYRAHDGGRFSNMKALEAWFFNIGGLRRYNQWLRYRYLKAFSLSIIRYCNVVLLDKGKEAALPNLYQRMKYIGIRSIYQIIYFVACTFDKAPFRSPSRPSPNSGVKEVCLAHCKRVRYLAVYPFRVCLWLVPQLMEGCASALYGTISEVLPDSAKDAIRNWEKTHQGVRHLRRLKREGKLFSGRSVKVVQLSILKTFGLRISARGIAIDNQ
jgi:glycosyltransferase involved in cell wall biosynthesis